jgi:hypothetical protein
MLSPFLLFRLDPVAIAPGADAITPGPECLR